MKRSIEIKKTCLVIEEITKKWEYSPGEEGLYNLLSTYVDRAGKHASARFFNAIDNSNDVVLSDTVIELIKKSKNIPFENRRDTQREHSISLGWNHPKWILAQAALKWSRVVGVDKKTVNMDSYQIESADIVAYLARAFSVINNVKQTEEDPYGLNEAIFRSIIKMELVKSSETRPLEIMDGIMLLSNFCEDAGQCKTKFDTNEAEYINEKILYFMSSIINNKWSNK